MRIGGRILLAVLNFYVHIEIRVVTSDCNRFVSDSTQTFNRCFNREASWFCRQSAQRATGTVDVSGETIR